MVAPGPHAILPVILTSEVIKPIGQFANVLAAVGQQPELSVAAFPAAVTVPI